MSFMNNTNNSGPIALPCKTPLERLVMLDKELRTFDMLASFVAADLVRRRHDVITLELGA